jgi:hypothetical protein
MKKLTQGMSEHNKALSAAKTDEAKANIVSQQNYFSSFQQLATLYCNELNLYW